MIRVIIIRATDTNLLYPYMRIKGCLMGDNEVPPLLGNIFHGLNS